MTTRVGGLGMSDRRQEKYEWNQQNKPKLLKVLFEQYEEGEKKAMNNLASNGDADKFNTSMKKIASHYMREFYLLFR